MELLMLLATAEGRLVSREEIEERLCGLDWRCCCTLARVAGLQDRVASDRKPRSSDDSDPSHRGIAAGKYFRRCLRRVFCRRYDRWADHDAGEIPVAASHLRDF